MSIKIFISDLVEDEQNSEYELFLKKIKALYDVIENTEPFNIFKLVKATEYMENKVDQRLIGINESEIFILVLSKTISNYAYSEYLFAKQRSLKILAFLEEGVERDPSLIGFLESSGVFFMKFSDITDLKHKFFNFLKDFLYTNSKFKEVKEVPKTNNHSTEIKELSPFEKKEWVKIGVIQLDFEINLEFPFKNKSIDGDYIKKVRKFLEIAEREEVEILLLPELSVNDKVLTELKRYSSKMIIIAGSQYKGNFNVCSILYDNKSFEINKIHPSKFEDSPIPKLCMQPGKHLFVLTTSKGRFSVLICDDFRHHGKDVQEVVEMIFVPSYNQNHRNFSDRASVLVEDHHKYVIIANAAKYGNSGIYGILDKLYLEQLKKEGLISSDAPTYELCSLKPGSEAIIVASLNLERTSVEVPTKILHNYANVRDIKVFNFKGNELKNMWS